MINDMSDKSDITLDEVFNPQSVAIVGASPGALSFATFAVHSLKEAGFPAIYPVNPNHSEAYGLPCYPSVSAIPGAVDHVVVCIPADKSLKLLDDCASKHVKSVHFFTAGFSETGEEKQIDLEKQMLMKARAGGFRIIGPNCTGLFIPKARFTLATRMPMTPGGIAFMSQSGGHSQELPLHAGPRGLTFSKVISYGNALDIDECELLEYFANDSETKIIAIYIEGVREGHRFRGILEKAAARKPVVIYKGGITQAGLRTTMSHTASMTSSVRVFEALCHQANSIQVTDLHEMIDALVALRFAAPYPRGRNTAVLGVGGGPSVDAADHMEAAGLQLPSFSEAVREDLMGFLPGAGAIFSNPLDATSLVFPDTIYQTVKVLGESPSIDLIMYHMGFHPVTRWGNGLIASEMFLKPAVGAFHRAHQESQKPVLLVLGPTSDMPAMEEFLKVQEAFVGAGLPVFRSIEKAAMAMSKIVAWRKNFFPISD
jgi:acetyltransferase